MCLSYHPVMVLAPAIKILTSHQFCDSFAHTSKPIIFIYYLNLFNGMYGQAIQYGNDKQFNTAISNFILSIFLQISKFYEGKKFFLISSIAFCNFNSKRKNTLKNQVFTICVSSSSYFRRAWKCATEKKLLIMPLSFVDKFNLILIKDATNSPIMKFEVIGSNNFVACLSS